MAMAMAIRRHPPLHANNCEARKQGRIGGAAANYGASIRAGPLRFPAAMLAVVLLLVYAVMVVAFNELNVSPPPISQQRGS